MDEWQHEQAARRELEARAAAVEAARQRRDDPDPVWSGGVAYCPECGAEFTARAMLGYGICVECAEARE